MDSDPGRVRIPRIVAAYSAGKFLNAKTARSQLMGGGGPARHTHVTICGSISRRIPNRSATAAAIASPSASSSAAVPP